MSGQTKNKKIRADQRVVDLGLAESRSRAQALILAGKVVGEHARIDKAGQLIPQDSPLRLKGRDHPWVSRGGLKLDHALSQFEIDVTGAQALDIGASTGGFTHVLLERGAAHVTAVDVGHGQLHETLRQDPRVIVLERTNARNLTADQVECLADIVTCDASFISLTKVLPASLALAAPGAHLVALIKPQFEAERGDVGKGGVVRDPAVHQSVCVKVRTWLEAEMNWEVKGLTESPVKGPEGNIEFLVWAVRAGPLPRPGRIGGTTG